LDDPVPGSEVPLSGGNLSTVVRVGETVRRPAGAWTPAVHELLDHLEAKRFAPSPRAIGLDESGREVLTFIPGETVGDSKPWPDWVWEEQSLLAVGSLLRAYHDVVRDFVPSEGAVWRLAGEARLAPGEIICHNDVAPYNLVRRHSGELALIDWDVSGPGTPAYDLAFSACAFAPMNDDGSCADLGWREQPDRAGRLRTLVDAYGLEQRVGFVDLMSARLNASIERISTAAGSGDPAFRGLIERGGLVPVEGALRTIERGRAVFQSRLE
jgi:hypothetical protein